MATPRPCACRRARSSPRPTRRRAEAARARRAARAPQKLRASTPRSARAAAARVRTSSRACSPERSGSTSRSPPPPTRPSRFEAPLRAHVDAGGTRTGELGEELRRLGAAEVELRQALTSASRAVSAIDVEVARIEAEADEARRRLEHAGTEERAEGDDRDELHERAERLERRRESLGQVNPLAKEEYDSREGAARRARDPAQGSRAEPHRAREAARRADGDGRAPLQRDLRRGAAQLRRGRGDALPRRRGPPAARRVRRTTRAKPGIEVELRPAGKKVQRLSLLSGGEKALGAISFLFALFLARPCPFYLLDEVEAALDDTNIGRFVELLRQYSDRAQFVVITHQKRTMEAADVLYGVTMGGDGVSQIVSRRLPREEAEAVSARLVSMARSWARASGRGRRRARAGGAARRLLRAPSRLALEVAPRAHRADRGRRVRSGRRRPPGSGSRRR